MTTSRAALMKAAVLGPYGPVIARVPVPSPGPTEILVRIHASSLNRADLLIIDGKSHGLHGGIGTRLGLEWAGDVAAVRAEVAGFRPGDRVMCSGTGGFAEYAVTDARRAFPIAPADMTYDEAACLTVALRTAHVALVTHGGLQAAQAVLVLGASSAVGLMCLQVAGLMGAGQVIGTSTRAHRRESLAGFGAHAVVDTGDPAWPEQVLGLTGGRGVDLVIDFLAGPYLAPAMRATAIGGRIVNVGRMAGEQGDFDLHSMRRIHYIGTTFRTLGVEEMGRIREQLRADLWAPLVEGRLRLPIDICMPLAEVADACRLMRRNGHFGKIVLTQQKK